MTGPRGSFVVIVLPLLKGHQVKFKSQIITQASGSIGGTTYSRNKGGMYQRARAIPTNPNSPQQAAVRSIMGNLAIIWGSVLTVAQRAVWTIYAEQVPLIDRLGSAMNVTGLNMFIRSNTPRVQAGLDYVAGGPTEFNLGSFTNPSFTATEATDVIPTTFDNTDDWANEDDAAALVYVSRPQNPSIAFFKGPYRLAGIIAGDATTPPTSPASITSPFAFNAGHRMFVRFQVSRADGRLSLPFRTFATGA